MEWKYSRISNMWESVGENGTLYGIDNAYTLWICGNDLNWVKKETYTTQKMARNAAEILENNSIKLTPTEQKIVDYIRTKALSNAEIAQQLDCSERTIESHMRNINRKLGTKNRTEIAIWKP